MTCRLVVDASNAAQLRFINDTVVKWLTSNQQRPGAPYKIIPPDPNAISREPVRSEGSGGGVAAVGAGAPDASLETIAPLPASSPTFPEGADVQRYTIVWTVELLPAGEPAPGASS